MQGIFIKGQRPKSKKEVREFVRDSYPNEKAPTTVPTRLHRLAIEATSMFGDEYEGPLSEMPTDTKIHFVGPDPHRNRKFYGTIVWSISKEQWIVH